MLYDYFDREKLIELDQYFDLLTDTLVYGVHGQEWSLGLTQTLRNCTQ